MTDEVKAAAERVRQPKPKRHYAWFVFNTTDEWPLLFTGDKSRAGAIDRFETQNLWFSSLNGRKVRRCEIVVVEKRRAKK